MWRVIVGFVLCVGGYFLMLYPKRDWFWAGALIFALGSIIWLGGNVECDNAKQYRNFNPTSHGQLVYAGFVPKHRVNSKFVHIVNQND
jgi:uncharacterized membrane protein YhhN